MPRLSPTRTCHFARLRFLAWPQSSKVDLSDTHSLNTANMSDNGEVEVEVPSVNSNVLPKDVIAEIEQRKLFNKWSYEDVEIRDISLTYD
jgi:hypothetical protein